MRLHQHVIASGVFSTGVLAITKSWSLTIISFFSGILVDLDHIIDYWREHPFKFDLYHFFSTCEECRLKQTYLILHSVEILIPLFILIYFSKSVFLLGFTLGLTQHLVLDYSFNYVFPFSYFYIYRRKIDFKNDKIFDFGKYQNGKNQQN